MRWIKCQKGNITLLSIASVSAMIGMFLIVFSLVNGMLVKGNATSSAEQASIAATSVLYEAINDAIDEYDEELEEELLEAEEEEESESESEEIEEELLRERIDEHIMNNHESISSSQKMRTAINDVLIEELELSNEDLENYLSDHMNTSINEATQAAISLINDNNGSTNDGEIIFFNDYHRIEVYASSRYESLIFDSLIQENDRFILDVGYGPEMRFLEYLPWFKQENNL